jgi:hypothetical protein
VEFDFIVASALFCNYTLREWRGSQVVRQRSAKPLYVGSTPTRASNLAPYLAISYWLLVLPLTHSEKPDFTATDRAGTGPEVAQVVPSGKIRS